MNRLRLFERDGAADHYPGWLADDQADELFDQLRTRIDWQERELQIMGGRYAMPRLIGYCGEAPYRYSAQTHDAATVPAALAALRMALNDKLGAEFNSILLNYYRDGRDSMSWHADNERQLGHAPLIASLSLGAPRRFAMRHRSSNGRHDCTLGHGDLLVMLPPMQSHWHHAVPKTRKPVAPRISITFRQVIDPP